MDGVLGCLRFLFSLFFFHLDNLLSGVKIFEEPTFQIIECKQTELSNQTNISSIEQLIISAKFNNKGRKFFRVFHKKIVFLLSSSRVYF